MNASCLAQLAYYAEWSSAAGTYDRSPLRNDTIAVSMNSCGKSARRDTVIDPTANRLQHIQAPDFVSIPHSSL